MRKPSSKENIVFCLTSTSLLDILLLFCAPKQNEKETNDTGGAVGFPS